MTHAVADVVLRAPTVVTGGLEHPEGWVAITGAEISGLGTGDPPPAHEEVRASGAVVPGFVDIHCHGGGGYAFSEGREAIEEALAYHRRHGTTRSVMSLVTASIADLVDQLSTARAACIEDPLLLGMHLEGPYLSPEHRGAHNPALLTNPGEADIGAMLEAADGYLAQVTIAPELPGAEAAIGQLHRAGVRVAVGHTAAGYDRAGAAFE